MEIEQIILNRMQAELDSLAEIEEQKKWGSSQILVHLCI